MLGVLSHLRYQPWFALAEFVDNAIQSFHHHRDALAKVGTHKLKVSITVDQADECRITIRDNAAGIHPKDFPRAFRAAEVPPSREGLSEFGMGMKSAACWFSPRWTVRTKALGDPVERMVKFDIDRIVRDSIEELEVLQASAKIEHHYTEVVLECMHKRLMGRTLGKVRQHLSEIYRQFVAGGELELIFNDEPLEYVLPEVLEASLFNDDHEPIGPPRRWWKKIDFDFGEDLKVTGFAALRRDGSTSDAGFSLFRRRRLIVGSSDEKYRPHAIFGAVNSYAQQRLFGELEITGFGVTHTKDGFQWDDEEDTFLGFLQEHLDSDDMPLLRQARNYRAKLNRQSLRVEAQAAGDKTSASIGANIPPVAAQISSHAQEDRVPEELPVVVPESLAFNRTMDIEFGGKRWRINIELTDDPAVGTWLETSSSNGNAKADGREVLGLRMSLVHPFMERFAGSDRAKIEPILRVAVALGIGEKLARDGGVKMAGVIRQNLNRLLAEALHKA